MGWNFGDPYRVRFGPFQCWALAILAASCVLAFGLIWYFRQDRAVAWPIVSVLVIGLLWDLIGARPTRKQKETAAKAGFRRCPSYHYPLVETGRFSLRCTECGFLGDASLVETTWKRWCGVR